MSPVAIEQRTLPIPDDRGLGVAYERWCFSRLLSRWAAEYRVASAMEGPIDGMNGVRGVHCVGLARAGVRVLSLVEDDGSAHIARAVYARAAPEKSVEVRVADSGRLAELPPCDLVLVYQGARPFEEGHGYLRTMARHARTVLVLVTHNPDHWGLAARRALGPARASERSTTEALAPVLWDLGRVRDHVYFDAPCWPAWPPARGASGRARSPRYVYGPERWPYFGGAGWGDELEPALVRRPSFETAGPRVLRRAARLHAFVLDLRPRTPQARRKLELARAGV
ncbi:MAG: hypothetical protein M3O50_18560 [Myxococcota bacterium]|nr:hypothetical protein [Myxococcota bacterium]